MVKFWRAKVGVFAGYLLLALGVWLGLMHQFHLDDSFITYRYARNMAQGNGLIYNTGDSILSTTAPLYAMLLAGLSFVVSDFHILGGLIGTVSIGIGAALLFFLLPPTIHWMIRAWGGVFYALSTVLWLTLGMETALWIALVLLAVLLAARDRWAWAGLIVSLAILVRPDAALPACLLGVMALYFGWKQQWRPVLRYVGAAALPLLAFAVWGWLTYGSPIPVTLGAKTAQSLIGVTGLGPYVTMGEGLLRMGQSLISQSPLYLVGGVLCLIGLSRRLPWPVTLVVAWGLLHWLAYVVMGTSPYRWYYAPLWPGLVLLGVYGLHRLVSLLSAQPKAPKVGLTAVLMICVLVAPLTSLALSADRMAQGGPVDTLLPVVDWYVYREIGEWLRDNTPEDAVIGVAEVGQLGFYAERYMTDYLGLLQPEATAMLRRGDLYSWLVSYAPDYLVLHTPPSVPLVLYNYMIEWDPWFLANYSSLFVVDDPRYVSGPVTVFERVNPVGAWDEQTVTADFAAYGLRLTGIALDPTTFPPDHGVMRVRLDWEQVGEIPAELHLSVKILGGEDVPAFDADYGTAQWAGAFSTWHSLVTPLTAEPSEYTVHVSVGPTGGDYQGHDVATLPRAE